MTVVEAVERARSQVGLGTRYQMGGGAHDPGAIDCSDERASCDCSAFVAWVLGYRKYQPLFRSTLGIEWLNTDGICRDAASSFGLFMAVALPVVGCVVVYPSAAAARAELLIEVRGPKVGHVGLVTGVKAGRVTSVIHCSGGNYRATGDAVQETDAAVFERVAYTRYAWCATVSA